jgi:hypothetical protein
VNLSETRTEGEALQKRTDYCSTVYRFASLHVAIDGKSEKFGYMYTV